MYRFVITVLVCARAANALTCEHGQKTETTCVCETKECSAGQYCNVDMVGGACLSSNKVIYDNIIPDNLHNEMGCSHGLRLSLTKPINYVPVSCANIRSTAIMLETVGIHDSGFVITHTHKQTMTHHTSGYCELEHITMLNKFVSDLRIVDAISDDTFGTVLKTISDGGYCSNPQSERKFTRGDITKEEITTQCKVFCYASGHTGFLTEYGDDIEASCTCMDSVYTGLECISYENYNWVNSDSHSQYKIMRVTDTVFERGSEPGLLYLFCPAKECSSGRIGTPCMCQNTLCLQGTCFRGVCLECDGCEFCNTGFNEVQCKCLSQLCDAGNYCSADGQCKLITDPENKFMIRAAYLS